MRTVCGTVIRTVVVPPPIVVIVVVVVPIPTPIHTVPRIIPRVPAVVTPIPRRGVVPRRVVVAPRVAPTEREVDRGTPATEHRGDVFRLDPHLIAHHDDVVEGGIVCRQECVRTAVTQVVVARRHIVVGRIERAQTTCVSALVGISHHSRVWQFVGICDHVIILLSFCSFCRCDSSLIFGATSFGFGFCDFGLACLSFGDGYAVVSYIQIVVVVSGVEGRRTPSKHRCGEQRDSHCKDVPHNYVC